MVGGVPALPRDPLGQRELVRHLLGPRLPLLHPPAATGRRTPDQGIDPGETTRPSPCEGRAQPSETPENNIIGFDF